MAPNDMRLRVLIAPDKFKGTLGARAAADALARGWRAARPGDRLTMLPITDGGDGFGEIYGRLIGARRRITPVRAVSGQFVKAAWWWEPKTRTAVIESAGVIGLALLRAGQRRPFNLDSSSLARVFDAAAKCGPRHCIVGIGGSATNDGGFGVAFALGWNFVPRSGDLIARWTELHRLDHIQRPASKLNLGKVIVAVDVQNPLLGVNGATRVYGPQKGLSPGDLAKAESRLSRLAAVYRRQFGRDLAHEPGAGAAGGLGFGLAAFFGARLQSGFELFARSANLDRHLENADLIITGEGAIDRSTLMGKGVGQLAQRCRSVGKPCVGLAGIVADVSHLGEAFTGVHSMTEMVGEAEAKARAESVLERLAERTARSWWQSPTS